MNPYWEHKNDRRIRRNKLQRAVNSFGFMPDFNEWVSLCDEGIFEGETREDVVDQAKKAIDGIDKERKGEGIE